MASGLGRTTLKARSRHACRFSTLTNSLTLVKPSLRIRCIRPRSRRTPGSVTRDSIVSERRRLWRPANGTHTPCSSISLAQIATFAVLCSSQVDSLA